MDCIHEQVTGLRQPYGGIHLAKAHAGMWHRLSTCCATSAQAIAVIGSLASPVPGIIFISDFQ